MTSKNFLSNKKNVKMSFSTSAALTDWVKRHVSAQRQKFPKDDRYRSVSSFIHHCMEYIMNIFEKGKTLEDFDSFVDQSIAKFYDQITFRAIIPHFEESIEMNKYILPSKGLLSFYSAFRNFFVEESGYDDMVEKIDKTVKFNIKRLENFLKQNNISQSFTIEKDEDLFILEYKGNYKNLHFDVSKAIAGIFGVVGFKIKNITYIADSSINYFYTRFDFESTELLKQKRPRLSEQTALGMENLKKLITYENILNDKSEHVWLNTSELKGALISFKDVHTGVEYLKSKIEELKKSVDRKELQNNVLKIFEHYHWIIIDNKKPLSFHFIIPKIEHEVEHEIMELILSEFMPTNVKMENQVIIE
ncbi:MAG: hypothetical protein ACFFBP_14425 [Promethearchaeota archaeon]